MLKKTLCSFAVLAVALPALAGSPAAPALDKNVGYVLLGQVAQAFQEMAAHGSGGTAAAEKMTRSLDKFMADAKKAKDQNQIDAVFFTRYQRILAVIKLVIQPDPGGILYPMIERELSLFVYEVLGEDWKGSGAAAINQVATAISEEIVNLYLYEDDIEKKIELRKSWDQSMAGPSAPSHK